MVKKFIVIVVGLLLNLTVLFAQPDDPPEPGSPPGEGEPIPLDGGILYLLAAGGAYGMKKIVDHKRKKKNE